MNTPDQGRRDRVAAALRPAKSVIALAAGYAVLAVLMEALRDPPRDASGRRLVAYLWLGQTVMFLLGALAFGLTKHLVGEGMQPSRRRWLVCFTTTFAGAAGLILVRGLQVGQVPEYWGVIVFIAAIAAPVLRLSKVSQV